MNHSRERDGKDCIRCWRNKLKHTNPVAKRFVKCIKLSEEELNYWDPKWRINHPESETIPSGIGARVYKYNLNNDLIAVYRSITEAAKAEKSSKFLIRCYLGDYESWKELTEFRWTRHPHVEE